MANTKSSGKPEYPLELFRHECARNAYHSMRRAHTQDMTRQDKTRQDKIHMLNKNEHFDNM
ncbi:hypothetical protein BLOT_013066 [Blomia tropicalis]|nr:hypothetical protein BLOT_013066 [Blomia tropicalis]